MKILILAGALYLLTVFTWVFYLAIMRLREAQTAGALTGSAKFFGYQILIPGLLLDTLFNWLVGTISFAEIPHEFLFTARCDRWLKSDTWRGKVANFYCHQLLDPFDISGVHCRK